MNKSTLSSNEAKRIIKAALLDRGWEVGKAWRSGIIHPSHPLRRWNLDAGRRIVTFDYRDRETDDWKPLMRYMATDLAKFIRDSPRKFNPFDTNFEVSLEAKASKAPASPKASKAPASPKASPKASKAPASPKASKKLSFHEHMPDTGDPYISASVHKEDEGKWYHLAMRPTSLDVVMSDGIEPWLKQFGGLSALQVRLERPFGEDSKPIPLASWSKRSGQFKLSSGAPKTLSELNKMRGGRGLPPVKGTAPKKSVRMTAQKIELLPGYGLTPYAGVPCVGPRAVRFAVDTVLRDLISEHDSDAIAEAITSVVLNYANRQATFDVSEIRSEIASAIELSSPMMADKSWGTAKRVLDRMIAERRYDWRRSEYQRVAVTSSRILVPSANNENMLRVACADIPKEPPSHDPTGLLDWVLYRLHAEQLGTELFNALMAVPHMFDGTLERASILDAIETFYEARWSPDINELFDEMEEHRILLGSWETDGYLLPESDPISPARVDRTPQAILDYYARKIDDWQSGRQAAAVLDDEGKPVTAASEYYEIKRGRNIEELNRLIQQMRKELPKPAAQEAASPSGPKLHGAGRTLITDEDAFDRLTEIEGPAWSDEQRKADYDPYGFFMNLEAFKTLQEMGLDKEGYMIVDAMPDGGGFLGTDGTGYTIMPDGEIVVIAETSNARKLAKCEKTGIRWVGEPPKA